MINDLILNLLPYVDGLPEDERQQRIAWIKNGDPLLGASTNIGHDGQLNAAALCIEKNVQTLDSNMDLAKDKINEIGDEVNKISAALEIIDDGDIINQITKNKEDIETLQSETSEMSTSVANLQQNVTQINGNIGVPDASEISSRTVRGDLFWIKSQMGQYADQDINGNSVVGNQSTGMKRRIITNTEGLAAQNIRLTALEEKVEDSDVGALTTAVNDIRTEIGPKASATSQNLYVRVKAVEDKTVSNTSDIDSLKVKIGFSNTKSITDRVSDNETSITALGTTLNTPTTGIIDRVSALEELTDGPSNVNSFNVRISKNESNVTSLQNIVGNSDTEGLRRDNLWLQNQIGSTPAGGAVVSGSILDRLTILASDSNQNASAIQDIQSDIGNNNEGIKGRVNTLTTKMDGTTGSGTTIETLGVFNFSKQLGTNKINDAASDGKLYARKNKAWVTLASSVASETSATYNITLTTSDTQIAFNNLQASSANNDVAVAAGLTVQAAGTYRIAFETEVASLTSKVQFKVKVGSADTIILKRFAKDSTETFIFGTADGIVKLNAGDVITLYAQALDSDSAAETVLNNVKFTLTPVL